MDAELSDDSYIVLVNDEEQFSLWPLHHNIPNGWRQVGSSGSKDSCVTFIESVWTDMRPRSLRGDASDVTGLVE